MRHGGAPGPLAACLMLWAAAAPATAPPGRADDPDQGAVYWTSQQAGTMGGALQAVDERLIQQSAASFDNVGEIYAPSAARGVAGRTFGALGRVTDWASIYGAYEGGDKVGMAQHATNAWLGGIVTGVAVTIGVAVATVAGVPLLIGGAVGALAGALVYGSTVQVGVDTLYDDIAQAQIGLPDRTARIGQARKWVAQADRLCADARRGLERARAGQAEIAAVEASAEWAEDLVASARGPYNQAEGSCGLLDQSANPDELARELDAGLGELEALVSQAGGYAGEACRMKSQMSQTSQPDAARIWNNEGQYLNGRVASTASQAKTRADSLREQAAIVGELNRIRERTGREVQAAQRATEEAATDLAGAGSRAAPAATVVQSAQRTLPEIQAAVDDCDRLKKNALQLLSSIERSPTVKLVVAQEVQSIDPPYALLNELRDGLGAGLATIEAARARVERAGSELQGWRSRLDRCAAAAVPSSQAEATAARVAGTDAQLTRLGDREARSEQCAQEASVLATGPGGWGSGEVEDVGRNAGGWGHGSVEEVIDTSQLAEAAAAAVAGCHYVMAVTYIDQILDKDSSNAWATTNRPEVVAWVERARLSRSALESANQQLRGGGEVQSAFRDLATARSNATPCDSDRIDTVWQRVKQEADRQGQVARTQAEQDRQQAERGREEEDRRRRDSMAGLVKSLGDLLTTLTQGKAGGGGGSTPTTSGTSGGTVARGGGGAPTAQKKSCSIIHASGGSDAHFLLEFPPNRPGAPTGYLVASVPAQMKSGSKTVCSSPSACLGYVVPYKREGARIVGQYPSRGAADAEARRRCPSPAWSQ